MKHERSSRAWRPVRARSRRVRVLSAWAALLFQTCLVLLPAAGAAAFFIISRDQLYAYELSEAGQRNVRNRVERLAGNLILLEFDRFRQWDDLIAMELMNGDIAAARGFLLSGRRMLPPREANQLDRRVRGDAGDAEIELAALELLTPGTRARYESTVPLLARRSASGAVQRRAPESMLGDQRDFELLASGAVSDPAADPMHLTLTGLGLGLGGDFTPRMAAGASALIIAARQPDYQASFDEEMRALIEAAMPAQRFQDNALAAAEPETAGAYPNAAAAFRASVIPARMVALKRALDEIGAMSEATSLAGAALLVTHAGTLRDLPRLRLVAQAAGDRAVAVAKGAPRDGRLARTARGDLTFNRDLMIALAVAFSALFGLVLMVGLTLAHMLRSAWLRYQEDPDAGELVETFNERFRPL